MEPIGEDNICAVCGSNAWPTSQVAHHLSPGTVLANGRFLVGRALGQGGFGITYIGRDLVLNMRVAIKEYYPASLVGRDCANSSALVAFDSRSQARLEAGKQRFLSEARVLAKFHNNPGIVDVRDFFEQNGTAYIVMDYLEGETLKDHLNRGTIDADQMFTLMQPIMDALELVHAEHVIHRDISPDNIMLRSDGTLCLMDFGAAHDMDYSDQRTVSMVLKSGYAPEEQYRAKGELGPWTDIYALCATMYRAITGIAPDESLQRLVSDEMAWPSDMGIRISSAQERVLKKGMALQHTDRYQTIAEMKADLNAASDDVCEKAAAALPGTSLVGERDDDSAPAMEKKRSSASKFAVAIAAVCAIVALIALLLIIPTHTVSFDATGGSPVESVSVNRLSAVEEPEAPVREGYEFTGWFLDESLEEKAEFPLAASTDTTLYADWKKTEASYRIEYLDASDNSQIADAKTVDGAKVGSEISETAPAIDGFEAISSEPVKLVVSEIDSDNVITFSYRKLVSYEVRFCDVNTGSDVSSPKTVDGMAEGTQITETAPEIPGYTLQSESEQTILLDKDPDKNTIVFQYELIPIAPSGSTSSGSGNSNGGSSSRHSSGSNDVQWAN